MTCVYVYDARIYTAYDVRDTNDKTNFTFIIEKKKTFITRNLIKFVENETIRLLELYQIGKKYTSIK
jgi:hypothetical protein